MSDRKQETKTEELIFLVSDKKQETKAEKFVRLANIRVSNALKAIRQVSKLGIRSDYEYDEKQVEKIMKALQHAVDNAGMDFNTNTDGHEFSL